MTHAMVKGSNIPLKASAVRAVLRWSPEAGAPDIDVSALLLGADGRVRSDQDFVFYNQPRHPSGLVRHRPKQRGPEGITDPVEVDLGALDASVECVVVAASVDSGSFGQVSDLSILVYDLAAGADPEAIAEYRVDPETGDESALNCGELYRRGDTWKFRAVGQGYTTGLVGLATAFGITVDDGDGGSPQMNAPAAAPAPAPVPEPQPEPRPEPEPQPEPEPAPAAAAAPAPAPAAPPPPPGPPGPPGPPQGGGYGYPPQQGGGYGYPPPPPSHAPQPSQPQPQQAGGYGYPQQGGGYGYPQQPSPHQPPQPQQGGGYGYPQQPAHPAYTQPQPQAQQPHAQPQPQPQPQQANGAQDGQGFTLPPQGPQFQPDRVGRR